MSAGFVAHPNGVTERIIETHEMPSREQARPATARYTPGDWVAPLPGRGLDFPVGRVERAEDCHGLDNDQVVVVAAGGMPHMVRASEIYRVKPSP